MAALDGRVAIITGAGSGLGRAHALHFASEGARVVVNDVGGDGDEEGAAKDVAAEILAAGGDAVAESSDVADWDAARQLTKTAVEVFGGIDILVNNAGI